MNTYLLLRDNKQSGPYSLDEIIAKGFKPYDLIWLEGKSAGWRYPSELPELKPHAPIVEEQPYERFYKKPSAQQTPEQQAPSSSPVQPVIVKENIPVYEKPAAKVINLPPKRIYVTFPGSQVKPTSADKEETFTLPVIAGNKMVPEESKKPESFISEASPPHSTEVIEKIYQQFSQDSNRKNFSTQQPLDEKVVPLNNAPKQSDRSLMYGLAAACLVLAGVVIGLLINYPNKRAQSDADKLVQQIMEKEKNAKPIRIPTFTPKNQVVDSSSLSLAIPALDNGSKKVIIRTAEKKDIDPGSSAGKIEQKNADDNINPAIVKNNGEPPSNEPVSPPADLEKVYKLVSLEGSKYKTGVLGGISNLQLTITNNSLYPLDEVQVELQYLGPEKRVVKINTISFTDLAPGEQKSVTVPKSNRGVSVVYNIKKISSKAFGLAKSRL